MTVYLDIIFIENLIINYIILYATGIISKSKIKQTRLIMSNELRRITKELGLAESGKNHEFRKYHSQIAVEYYVSKGWDKEKAEQFVIQRHT